MTQKVFLEPPNLSSFPPELQTHLSVRLKKLLDIKHPNVAQYIDVSTDKDHLPRSINYYSLQMWLVKLQEESLHLVVTDFARAIGAQLLLGLSYLHTVRGIIHGGIDPDTILLDDEGGVALHHFHLVKEIMEGAPPPEHIAINALKNEDIRAVARIMFCIASKKSWQETTTLTSRDISDHNLHPALKRLIIKMYEEPAQADSFLFDFCFGNTFDQHEAPFFNYSDELKKSTSSVFFFESDPQSAQCQFGLQLFHAQILERNNRLTPTQKEEARHAFYERHTRMLAAAAIWIRKNLIQPTQKMAASLTLTSDIFKQYHFNENDDVCAWRLPSSTHANNKTTIGQLTYPSSDLPPIHRQHLLNLGVIVKHEASSTTIPVACKTNCITFSDELITNSFSTRYAELRDLKHPNLVRYLSIVLDEHKSEMKFFTPVFQYRSLDLVLVKLKSILPKSFAADLARAVGAQLLLGLSYLHEVCDLIHGDLKPSHILFDIDGNVAIKGFRLTQEIIGAVTTPLCALIKPKIDDMLAVARLIYCIASGVPWENADNLTVDKVEALSHPHLRHLIHQMLKNPELEASSFLLDPCFSTAAAPSASAVFEIPTEQSSELQELLSKQSSDAPDQMKDELQFLRRIKQEKNLNFDKKDMICQAFYDRHRRMVDKARLFIKTDILSLFVGRPARVCPSEWQVNWSIQNRVDYIKCGDEIRHRFSLSVVFAVVKTYEFEDGKLPIPARRALTILFQSRHPNIIGLLFAAHGKETVYVATGLADKGSLRYVMQHGCIPREKIVPFILGIACQVLNALLYLDTMLKVAHGNLTPEHILLCEDGTVKLCGFNSRNNARNPATTDMSALSEILLNLCPIGNDADAIALREFALTIKNKTTPYQALQHTAMVSYYTELFAPTDKISTTIESLKQLKILGKTPVEDLINLRAFAKANPNHPDIEEIQLKMFALILRRERAAVMVVSRGLVYTSTQWTDVITPNLPIFKNFNFKETNVSSLLPLAHPKTKTGTLVPRQYDKEYIKQLKLIDQSFVEQLNNIHEYSLLDSGLIQHVIMDNSPIRVACKTIPVLSSPQFVYEKLRDIKHPNLVQYIDISMTPEKQEVHFLMPLFNRGSLDSWGRKLQNVTKKIAEDFAIAVGAQLFLGLFYLHDVRGMAHGHVHPKNILLNDNGRVAMKGFSLTQELTGAKPPKQEEISYLQDIRAVVHVMWCIATATSWDTLRFPIDPNTHVCDNLSLREFFQKQLNTCTPAATTAELCLFASCFRATSEPAQALVFFKIPSTIPDELKELLSIQESNQIPYMLIEREMFIRVEQNIYQNKWRCQAIHERHMEMVEGAASFIKKTLRSMVTPAEEPEITLFATKNNK